MKQLLVFPIMQDARTENGGNGGPFNNALTAKMVANMYGLLVRGISVILHSFLFLLFQLHTYSSISIPK